MANADKDGREIGFKMGFEFKIFSQHGEDGILLYIFSKIGTTNRHFVEIGCGPGHHNTANLAINHGWSGLLVDKTKECVDWSRDFFEREMGSDSSKVKVIQCCVTIENVEPLLSENGLSGEIDLLSIDVDGNDYWIWKAINKTNPRVVVIEYNASIDPERCVTVKYNPEFNRMGDGGEWCYHGASLTALIKLGRDKGYQFVGCNSHGYNAFFIRNGLLRDKIEQISVKDAYYPCQGRENMSLNDQYKSTKDFCIFEEV